MSFESKLTVFGYYKGTTGEYWPDYVILDNGGILSVEYETRKYYPVDRDALLKLADELDTCTVDRLNHLGEADRISGREYARRIREDLGVEDADNRS